MTGYGQSRIDNERYLINVEIKTLNSKFLDVSVRLPKVFNDKEMEVRNYIGEQLERGKVTVNIEFTRKNTTESQIEVNSGLFKKYYALLNSLASEVDADKSDIFRLSVQFPEVLIPLDNSELNDNEWKEILTVFKDAVKKCNEFRITEGNVLTGKLSQYLKIIDENLQKIERLDPQRIIRIKERLNTNLKEFVKLEELDMNRLEQELIYYIEKLDISEEKVRLKSHIDYFNSIMVQNASMGKKMNFISQEIGREINTIGSKANDAEIQKLVVNMKEELEKIKEQILNIL